MGRAIVTSPRFNLSGSSPSSAEPVPHAAVPGGQVPPDTYKDRLFKYIPGEIVTLYLGARTAIETSTNSPHVLHWIVFILCLVATPLYLWRNQQVKAWRQLAISTVSFVVWAFALGGPFTSFGWYRQAYGAVCLPIFTFLIAAVRPDPPQQSNQSAG
jgi:hypothetical protein